MLDSLHVENFAIIDQIDIDFKAGLSALTGETGAGKSLIIDAIGLLTGARSSSSIVRTGENKAIVEGVFSNISPQLVKLLDENEIEHMDNMVTIRRDIYATGKSVFRVNGLSVNLSLADILCDNLFDIHTQNDTMRLFDPKNYLSFIDDEECFIIKGKYLFDLAIYVKNCKKYNTLCENHDKTNNDLDYLKFQLEELTKAKLIEGELEDLENELVFLNNHENIFEILSTIKTDCEKEKIEETVYEVLKKLQKLQTFNPKYIEYTTNVENAYFTLQDLISTINDEITHFDFDESRLNEVNERIDLLHRLTKKYHRSIHDLILYKEELKTQIDLFDNADVYLKDSLHEVEKSFQVVKEDASQLTMLRKEKAEKLQKGIIQTLHELMLSKVTMQIVFQNKEITNPLQYTVFEKNGVDKVDFLLSYNVGEPLHPLSKVASGGEMSRTMLALKCHLFVNKKLSTIIFDEIDTGMNGKVAEVVADKLKEMSKKTQVLAITHLPIVAAKADHQLFVSKKIVNERTVTSIEELSYERRIDCLAEMISPSDTTGKAKEVAKLMLN